MLVQQKQAKSFFAYTSGWEAKKKYLLENTNKAVGKTRTPNEPRREKMCLRGINDS